MREIWKEIPGFPGYKASNLGRIKSLPRSATFIRRARPGAGKIGALGQVTSIVPGGILKPTAALKGKSYRHYYVGPSLGGRRMMKNYVHRLVWIAFRGPIPYGLVINHLDHNPANNAISNLEAVTQKQNLAWARAAGRMSPRGSAKVGKK